MQTPSWRDLRGVDPLDLGEARLQAHYAAQWLARAARAYIPALPDDSHTNLGWIDAIGGFETHRLHHGSHLGLGVADHALVFTAAGQGVAGASFPLAGCTDAQARIWLRTQFTVRGLKPDALDGASPYAMPAHPIAGGAPYGGKELAGAFGELAAWFANAEAALTTSRAQISAKGLPAPAPRCWPHHFDLATQVHFPTGDGKTTAYAGAGFSPGDHYYDEPYFYVSLYPAPDAATLPALPAIGHWHSQEFTAAVAPASKIVAAHDQQAGVAEFLAIAVDTAIATLQGIGRR